MKSPWLLNFAALLLPVLMGSVYAQEMPPYPGGQPLKRAPEMSSWQITCQLAAPTTTPAATGTPSPRPPSLPFATMTVVKTKNLRSVESIDPAGLKTERFYDGSVESYTESGSSTPRYFFGDNKKFPGFYIDFSQTDFPECAWIKAEMYTGVETISDHKCLVFTDKIPSNSQVQMAYVDVDTRLPIKNQVGSLTYTYQYLPPPTEMLTLPVLMKARVDFDAQRAKALSVHPAAE